MSQRFWKAKESAIADFFQPSTINYQLSTNSNPPERPVRAKLGNFAGGSFANVNGDANDTDKRAGEDQRHEPGRNVPDTQGLVKGEEIVNRRAGMQKYFC